MQLVGGEFDLEMNFIIQEAESIGCMVELLSHCEVTCQAEIWSMFTAILRKSVRNLQTSTEVGLIQQVLLKMSTVDDMIAGNAECVFSSLYMVGSRCQTFFFPGKRARLEWKCDLIRFADLISKTMMQISTGPYFTRSPDHLVLRHRFT